MPNKKSSFFTHCLAGIAIGGLVHAFFYPVRLGLDEFWLKFFLVQTGNLFALFVFGPAAYFFASKLKRNFAQIGLSLGIAISVSALCGAWWFASSARPRAMLEMGIPCLLILLWWQPLKLKARLAAGLGYINLLVIVLLALSVGRVDLTQADEFDLAEAPELVIPAVDGEGSVGHPDVLLISVDTLRADTTIDPLIPTPNIDKLKAVSYFSDYAVAPSPVTLPSHISMVTGELPTVHAAYTNLGRMPVASVTLGEAFQQAGYSTVAVASNSLLNHYTGFSHGFDLLVNVVGGEEHIESYVEVGKSGRRLTWYSAFLPDAISQKFTMRLIICRYKMKSLSDDSSDSTADLVNDLTTKYLSTLLANERPYFYFLHYMDSHAPYSASPEFADQLSVQHPLPERYSSFANGSLALCKQVLADQIDGIADSRLGFNNLLARYGEELMKVDQSIGEVLDLISASGRPTVILFTSDHGELFGENDSVLHGDNVHAGVIRVPFMLSIPGQKQLRQFAVRPALTDVPLTLLNAAGFKAKSFGSGRNLLSEKAASTALLAVSDQQFSVEQGGFKMMFEWQSAEGNDSDLSPFALYQTSEGVTEEHNLIDNPEYAAQRASLLEEARQILETAVKRDMRAFDDAERVRLSELGYAFDEDGNAVETNH